MLQKLVTLFMVQKACSEEKSSSIISILPFKFDLKFYFFGKAEKY